MVKQFTPSARILCFCTFFGSLLHNPGTRPSCVRRRQVALCHLLFTQYPSPHLYQWPIAPSWHVLWPKIWKQWIYIDITYIYIYIFRAVSLNTPSLINISTRIFGALMMYFWFTRYHCMFWFWWCWCSCIHSLSIDFSQVQHSKNHTYTVLKE